MKKVSKYFPNFWRTLGVIGIYVGFLGMLFILYFLVKGTIDLIFVPGAPPAVAPVLPGVKIPGLPILSFWHWIIGILVVAVIHEFSHGIFSKLYKIKVKSSGFAFLGPILAAFVEPDEKQLKKSSTKAQLSVLAAGPFSNIVTAFIVLLLVQFVFFPIQTSITEPEGLYIVSIDEGSPANISGMQPGTLIKEINGISVSNTKDLIYELENSNNLILVTDKGDYNVVPDENDKIGVQIQQTSKYKDNVPKLFGSFYTWLMTLLFWLWVINLGIGLFNLLPVFITDGGRMLPIALSLFIKKKKTVSEINKYVSIFIAVIIFINLWPYILKLLTWIVSPLLNLL
ncbi:site-2 protease family protein [archaeon]|nr:site-2 protease family protein [archaeon]